VLGPAHPADGLITRGRVRLTGSSLAGALVPQAYRCYVRVLRLSGRWSAVRAISGARRVAVPWWDRPPHRPEARCCEPPPAAASPRDVSSPRRQSAESPCRDELGRGVGVAEPGSRSASCRWRNGQVSHSGVGTQHGMGLFRTESHGEARGVLCGSCASCGPGAGVQRVLSHSGVCGRGGACPRRR
jgi:hypothetical protein